VDVDIQARAQEVARRAANAVNMVGTIGVEMFLAENGDVLVNELAPRPHNSGHYSLDACRTSQFENHVRAVCGLPLGSTKPTVEQAVMFNLLGDGHGSGKPSGLDRVLASDSAKLHLYGKAARPGRKLGHLTLLGERGENLEQAGQSLLSALSFKEMIEQGKTS
jgi:5-(carboxyamino)imidazole ribonucleotide synthase